MTWSLWCGEFVLQYIVPSDVGIEMMSFGLLFEFSFEFSQFSGYFFARSIRSVQSSFRL